MQAAAIPIRRSKFVFMLFSPLWFLGENKVLTDHPRKTPNYRLIISDFRFFIAFSRFLKA